MINEKNYARMATEVLEILKYLPKEQVEKIPKSLIEQLEKGMDNSLKVVIDESKRMVDQDVCNETYAMIYLFYRDYMAEPEEKEKINKILKKLEKKYNEKYSVDNLFKNINSSDREID